MIYCKRFTPDTPITAALVEVSQDIAAALFKGIEITIQTPPMTVSRVHPLVIPLAEDSNGFIELRFELDRCACSRFADVWIEANPRDSWLCYMRASSDVDITPFLQRSWHPM